MVRVVAGAEALARGLHQLAHARRGGQVSGPAPVPAGHHRRGRVGPARYLGQRARGKRAGARAPARRARGRLRGAQTRPPASGRTGWSAQRAGEGGLDRRRRARTSRPGGSGAAPLTCAGRGPTDPLGAGARAAAAQPEVAAMPLDERLARAARSRRGARGDRGARSWTPPSPRPASRGASPGASWRRRSACWTPCPVSPRRSGPGWCRPPRDDAAGVGALRGGARLARRQLAGLGADARRRLGAGGRQRALLARPAAAPGVPPALVLEALAGPWPRGRDRGGRPARP